MTEVYLDHAATTPLLPAAIEAMTHTLQHAWGNPSSVHAKGIEAERIVTDARRNLARALAVRPAEIVFTSGGTEANALAVKGGARVRRTRLHHIVTAATEHSSVRNACAALEDEGFDVTVLPVDEYGRVSPEQVAAAVREHTAIVSLMWVNNELGAIHPISAIADAVKAANPHTWFHVDAVQALGKLPLRLSETQVDFASFSAHKIGGPKGVGALWMRDGTRLAPLFGPGSQEQGWRPGTENVPGIAGFGAAVAVIAADMELNVAHMEKLRDELWQKLAADLPWIQRNAHGEADVAPHILNASFPGLKGEVLVNALAEAGVFASTGSACSARRQSRGHVLAALGLDDVAVEGALRFSIGTTTTKTDIDTAAERIVRVAVRLREFARL